MIALLFKDDIYMGRMHLNAPQRNLKIPFENYISVGPISNNPPLMPQTINFLVFDLEDWGRTYLIYQLRAINNGNN